MVGILDWLHERGRLDAVGAGMQAGARALLEPLTDGTAAGGVTAGLPIALIAPSGSCRARLFHAPLLNPFRQRWPLGEPDVVLVRRF
jgi:hypothetical protein